jgi:hypothetical protein
MATQLDCASGCASVCVDVCASTGHEDGHEDGQEDNCEEVADCTSLCDQTTCPPGTITLPFFSPMMFASPQDTPQNTPAHGHQKIFSPDSTQTEMKLERSLKDFPCVIEGNEASILDVAENDREEVEKESVWNPDWYSEEPKYRDMRKFFDLYQDETKVTLSQVLNTSDVGLSDQNEELSIFCYSHSSDVNNPLVQGCRGVIFNKEGELVSKAFGYTPMFSPQENPLPAEIEQYLREHFEECQIYPSYEGALVRVFCYKEQWYLTTHRKLDAFKSYWGSQTSFGCMFLEALEAVRLRSETFAQLCPSEILLESFYHLLDPKYQYVFLLRNVLENRIVSTPPQLPEVVHVATFHDGKMVENPNIHIPQQAQILFNSLDEALAYVKTIDPFDFQGLVFFLPNGKQLKVCSDDYYTLFNLRGNEPSVMFQYLKVYSHAREVYRELYPENTERFNEYDKWIQVMCEELYQKFCGQEIPESKPSRKKRNERNEGEKYTKEERELLLLLKEHKVSNLGEASEVVTKFGNPTQLNRVMRLTKLAHEKIEGDGEVSKLLVGETQ